MISASHNPAKYNGIKLFNNKGYKLADEIEEKIEHYILDEKLPECTNIGRYERDENLKNKYNKKYNINSKLECKKIHSNIQK